LARISRTWKDNAEELLVSSELDQQGARYRW
jgi:hypothetical protein